MELLFPQEIKWFDLILGKPHKNISMETIAPNKSYHEVPMVNLKMNERIHSCIIIAYCKQMTSNCKYYYYIIHRHGK